MAMRAKVSDLLFYPVRIFSNAPLPPIPHTALPGNAAPRTQGQDDERRISGASTLAELGSCAAADRRGKHEQGDGRSCVFG
jgi:hypothetical protein